MEKMSLHHKCSVEVAVADDDGKTVKMSKMSQDQSTGYDSEGHRGSISGASKSDMESEESCAYESMSYVLTRRRSELIEQANSRHSRRSTGESSPHDSIDRERGFNGDFSQETKAYLDSVFARACQDGSKEIFFVRACAPTDDKLPEDSHQHSSKVFEHWHPPDVRSSGVDPCLSDLAVYAASVGVPREMICSETCCEFMGLEGGLQSFVRLIEPQLVVSSPHSSALQTAMIACDEHRCPIIVHPDLKHIKKDLTAGGMYPEGKPKFQGVRASELSRALQSDHPYKEIAKMVDLSMLPEVWFNPTSDFKAQKRRIRSVPTWLSQRPEQRIMVVTHNRVLRHLVGVRVGNGQYAIARLSTTGDLYTTPTIGPYKPLFHAHGDDEGSKPSDKVTQVLLIRHCQDEVLPVEQGRVIAERFEKWHPQAHRDADVPAEGCKDPCLTELGIRAASNGIEDKLRCSMNSENGYGGVRGGLRKIIAEFDAELVVSSPLSRAIQTAIVAFDDSDIPVMVHPDLKELKKDYTFGGRFPVGKPGCSGVPASQLRDAIARHPRASGASVDTSLIDQEVWFNPHQKHESQLERLEEFVKWLSDRPEQRIAVVSHGGVLRQLLHTELGHGQYIVAELHKIEQKRKFIVVQFSAGVQPYFE
mmetsp:Transcript_36787/g.80139  ORF Transcript_36787/g.80139 Transcript_36787/m.80139 type:complete len:646 (-) Transcript_36787:321-2258(-)|eukprot:CAMPEP_0118951738 /NCGR_PEP_ID=MMETSP1169-20130426/53626_1 /TAXON_ID=36882 /ORGANISM="Pyramimonas obovata, Strain CCMP722" /LENGTH=645 /DNA_ID=CAMNT_0006898851 /DNA_START=617 /DNA_END=2554 /DNA_ORIENTATION=-